MSLRCSGSGRNLRKVGSRKSGTPSRSTSRAASSRQIASGKPWRWAIASAMRSSAKRSAQRRPVSERSTPRKAARAARTSEDMPFYSATPWGAFLPAPFEGPDAHDGDVDTPGLGAADLQGQRLALHVDLDAMHHTGAFPGAAGSKFGQPLVVLNGIDPTAVRQ